MYSCVISTNNIDDATTMVTIIFHDDTFPHVCRNFFQYLLVFKLAGFVLVGEN